MSEAFIRMKKPMIDLTGKVALITGSSRGIGHGCAVEMARVGADIAINYNIHSEDAEAVAHQIREMGRRADVFQADVSDRTAVDAMVSETVARLGRLDIIVCNAYYNHRGPFLEIPIEGIRRTLDVCLIGSFHAAQSGARQMVAQGGGGSILFISSIHAAVPAPGYLAYNTAKAGINQMSATIASELAPKGIRSNVIEPGWIDTPGERAMLSAEIIAEEGKKLPWGRVGTIEDIGRAATFLVSDAADYVTGSVLRVDGGSCLRMPG
jgi:glucose 1-dehydrogenase